MAPKGFTELPDSEAMRAEIRHYEGPTDVGEVYIDGSAYEVGWSVWARGKPVFCDSGPVEGRRQTAARAEVRAVFEVLARAGGPVNVATDSKHVRNIAWKLQGGAEPPTGAHADLWRGIAHNMHKLGAIR